MKRVFGAVCGFGVIIALSGCGVDGPPEPVKTPAKGGLTVSGTASVGVTGSF